MLMKWQPSLILSSLITGLHFGGDVVRAIKQEMIAKPCEIKRHRADTGASDSLN